MICTICRHPAKFIFHIANYKIYECQKCGHRYTLLGTLKSHVKKTYSDNYFYGGGAGYPNYLDERELLIRHGHYYGELLAEYIDSPGKVLDVGAAAGFVLKGLANHGWICSGIEVNDKMAAYGRENLGLKIKTGLVEDLKADEKYDLICFIQVIAHLIDPGKALTVASNALSEGGYILIETWDYKSLTARLFGKRWHEYSPPSVLNWFSKISLNAAMKNLNFELLATGRPEKKLSFKHAKSVIQYKLENNSILRCLTFFLKAVPENLTVPYPGNDLFWALYRKSR
jgi:2-polyprenyl-3-methyl-5-hydroxy-6-metoxy-1,4-benzoquinol methylase